MPQTFLAQHGERLSQGALVFGLVPIGLGINAILRPFSALAMFQFSLPDQPEDQKLAGSLMQVYGARDLALGLGVVGVWYTGNRKALGWMILAGLPVMLVDGYVSRKQIGKAEWNHWGFVPISIAIGSGLLGWI